MSTELAAGLVAASFELDRAWEIHPSVSVRPERFGALLYHFGTRRLSFLKDPLLLDVIRGLDHSPSARDACAVAGVRHADLPRYQVALATLAGSSMIRRRGAAS